MANSPSQKRYPTELKERAVKMVLDLRREDPKDHGVINRVARQLGVGSQSLPSWVNQAEKQNESRAATPESERDELLRLRQENRELKRANTILQAASTSFGAEPDRRSQK